MNATLLIIEHLSLDPTRADADQLVLAAAVDEDSSVWIVHDPANQRHDVTHGHVRDATHEALGVLPTVWSERVRLAHLRCVRPTKTGEPCWTRVSRPGTPCHRHRTETVR